MAGTGFDEEEAIAALKRKDERAYERIIEHYSAYVGAVTANTAGGALSREDLEEIAADSFYVLWENAAKLRPGKLKGYLGTVARNKTRKALRKAGQELPLEEDLLLVSTSDPERELTQAEEAALLHRALDDLPEPDRTVFIRRYGLCQKIGEIARQMELNENTVRTKLRRGLEKLQKVLTEEGFCLE